MDAEDSDVRDYAGESVRDHAFQRLPGHGAAPVLASGASLADALFNYSTSNGNVVEGLNLNGLDLTGMTLCGCVVRHCSFDGALLHDARISGTLLQDVSFVGADFSAQADLDALRTSFYRCKFMWVRGGRADFTEVKFKNCSFQFSAFRDCSFKRALIEGSDIISDPDWEPSDFTGSVFDGASVRASVIAHADMARTSWKGAEVFLSDFARHGDGKASIMRYVNLDGAVFGKTVFRLAKDTSLLELGSADPSGLRLLRADALWPSDAIVRGGVRRSAAGRLAEAFRHRLGGRANLGAPWHGAVAGTMADLEEEWLAKGAMAAAPD